MYGSAIIQTFQLFEPSQGLISKVCTQILSTYIMHIIILIQHKPCILDCIHAPYSGSAIIIALFLFKFFLKKYSCAEIFAYA